MMKKVLVSNNRIINIYHDEELPDLDELGIPDAVIEERDMTYSDEFGWREVNWTPPINQAGQIEQLEHKLLNANERYQQLDKFTISLDELKQFKLEQLKYFCSEAIYSGFISSINEYAFGFNELDQANFTQQTLLIVAAGGNYTAPIAWKTKNFGVVELTVTEFNTIINEAAAHKLTQQNKYWQLEQEVLQAAAPNEVDAIVW